MKKNGDAWNFHDSRECSRSICDKNEGLSFMTFLVYVSLIICMYKLLVNEFSSVFLSKNMIFLFHASSFLFYFRKYWKRKFENEVYWKMRCVDAFLWISLKFDGKTFPNCFKQRKVSSVLRKFWEKRRFSSFESEPTSNYFSFSLIVERKEWKKSWI